MPITIPKARQFSRILGVGGARASRVVTNEEMCTMIDSTPEWIEQRTGIVERRWVAEGESALTLAEEAARKALERSGVDAANVDTLIISTVSHYMQTPSMAAIVAEKLGMGHPAVFDISAACAGFCYALGLADALVRAGNAKHVLIVGSEVLSEYTDTEDRGTAFLFGDGAGAAVVGPSDVPAIGPTVWGSEPAAHDVITIDDWRQAAAHPYIHMEGRAVFKWATTAIADKAKEALAASGIAAHELDAFIPHQANNRITDSMLRHLGLPEGVVVARDIRTTGNTSAASVPLAMEALLESGEATSGQTALIIGFGAGLVYGAQVITLP